MALPPKATSTVSGEILLSGDLAGTGDLPVLRPSGVNLSSVAASKRVSVDSKGRITSIGGMSNEESDALVDAAYAADPSKFTIVAGRPVLNFPIATTSVAGLVKSNPLTIPVATTGSTGVMQVGAGLAQHTVSAVPGVENTYPSALSNAYDANTLIGNRDIFRPILQTSSGYAMWVSSGCATSADLINWSVTSLATSVAAWANIGDTIIASLRQSTVVRSTDGGVTWSPLTMPALPAGDWWNCVYADGTTWIVSSGGRGETGNNTVATSINNGNSWTTASLPNTNFAATCLRSITKVGSTFYATGYWWLSGAVPQNAVLSSTNGLTWTPFYSQSSSDGILVVTNVGGKLLRYIIEAPLNNSASSLVFSLEGTNWVQHQSYGHSPIRVGAAGAVRQGVSTRSLCFSPDGMSWTNRQIPSSGSTLDETTIQQTFVGSASVSLLSQRVNHTVSATEARAFYYLDGLGIDGAQLVPPTGGNTLASFGPSQRAFTNSTTAATQTLATRNRENLSYAVTPSGEQACAAASSTTVLSLRRTVAGRWISSFYNGTTWTHTRLTTIPPGTSPSMVGMAFGGGTYCAIGTNTGGHWWGVSSDGVNWTFGTLTFTGALSAGLVYAFGLFISAGRNASGQFAFATSANGTTWTSGSVATSVSPPTAIAVGVLLGSPIVLATCGQGGSTGVTNSIWRTATGTSWFVNSSGPFVNGQDTSLTFDPVSGYFLQGGGTNLPAVTGGNRRQLYSLRWNASLTRYDAIGEATHIPVAGGAAVPGTASSLDMEHVSVDSTGKVYWTQGNARFTLTSGLVEAVPTHVGINHPISTSTQTFLIRGAGANIGKVGTSTVATPVSSFTANTFNNFSAWTPQSIIPLEQLIGVSTENGLVQRIALTNTLSSPHNVRLTFGNAANPVATFESGVRTSGTILLEASTQKSLVALRVNGTTLVFEE